MPDITMCSGEECHKKHTCFRYLAVPHERQSYFMVTPLDKKGDCSHYWNWENKETKIKLNTRQ